MELSHPDLPAEFEVTPVAPFGVLVRPQSPSTPLTRVPVAALRELARRHHLVALRGFDTFSTAEELSNYAGTWGNVLGWPFGNVLELVQHEAPADHVFDNSGVSFHWDGMFVDQIPEFQIFQCVHELGENQGGRTIFCDTTRVLADADPATRASWEKITMTYRIKNESHYGGRAVAPLVDSHPDRGFPVMRYLERVPEDIKYINRPRVEFGEVPDDDVDGIEKGLRETLYDPRHFYAHPWQTGDVVIADNYTLLHGREPYSSQCGRHLRRVHVLGEPALKNAALR